MQRTEVEFLLNFQNIPRLSLSLSFGCEKSFLSVFFFFWERVMAKMAGVRNRGTCAYFIFMKDMMMMCSAHSISFQWIVESFSQSSGSVRAILWGVWADGWCVFKFIWRGARKSGCNLIGSATRSDLVGESVGWIINFFGSYKKVLVAWHDIQWAIWKFSP